MSKKTSGPHFKKSVNTEIKHIHGKWYLYERSFRYDPERKKSVKVSAKLLGCVTSDGFVAKKVALDPGEGPDVLEFGAVQYFHERTSVMRERLMEFFPGIWERVYAIAMLRTVYGPRLCKVEDNYQDSMIGQAYKGLALSPASISDLMSHLGRQRAAMDGFMRSMAGSGPPLRMR